MLKFSVIVPIYNVEEYIEECVYSVLRQTYNNFELILVNDASPDYSLDIITKIAEKDSRIVIIDKEKNEGVALARSSGLANAKGDYVVYLDGDDQLIPEALKILATKIDSQNPDIVIFPKIKERNGVKHVNPYFPKEMLFEEDKKELYKGFLSYSYFVIGCAAINRELAVQYDIANELKEIWLGEDLLQSLPLLTHAKRILYIIEGIYIMVYNPDSATRSKVLRKDRYLQAIENHKVIEQYIQLWDEEELQNDFHEHVMNDVISYAFAGCRGASSVREGSEYLQTIGSDVGFRRAYSLGYPKKMSHKILAFFLKHELYVIAYCLIKMKERLSS